MTNETPTHAVETPSYYAVIPANVRYSTIVSDGAKLLYGEITCLCNKHGYCWASNKYFSELYSKSSDTISRWISELARAGFIFPIVDNASGNSRKIWLSEVVAIGKNEYSLSAKIRRGYRQKSVEGIGKNAEHNNKVNNKSKKVEGKAKKTPPPDYDSFMSEVERLSVEAKKEKAPSVAGGFPGSGEYGVWDAHGNPLLVQSFDGQTLPGSLIATTEVIEPSNPNATAKILQANGREIQCETADDANDLITAWTSKNMPTVEIWYGRSKRKLTADDLQNITTKFCGNYANHSDSGKRLRFMADPVLFFRNQFSGWLVDQNKYDREHEAKQQNVAKKHGAPNGFGGDMSKYSEPQKF